MKERDLKGLPPLSIPIAQLSIQSDKEGNLSVYDSIRKKFVSLTPEEWVRQNFIHWLIDFKGYPPSLISNEVSINLNNTQKRSDAVIYDRSIQPLILIEFKAPGVEINQSTFDQIAKYNLQLKAKYLIVSNGVRQYCCKMDYKSGDYHFIPQIPSFNEAIGQPSVN